MIRIIYSWKVKPEKVAPFIEAWKRTTNLIHDHVEGARGSFMLQNNEDTKDIKTIARWDSLKDWEKFWHDTNGNQMRSMHDLAEQVSVEVFDEIDDFTR